MPQRGSVLLTGDAAIGDVRTAKTFYKDDPNTKLTGTLAPTHDDQNSVLGKAIADDFTAKYQEHAIPTEDELELLTRTLTVVEGATIEAGCGTTYNGVETANKLKMRLYINELEVSESAYLQTDYSLSEVAGYKEGLTAGDIDIDMRIYNYDTEERWYRKVTYYLFGGSVKA